MRRWASETYPTSWKPAVTEPTLNTWTPTWGAASGGSSGAGLTMLHAYYTLVPLYNSSLLIMNLSGAWVIASAATHSFGTAPNVSLPSGYKLAHSGASIFATYADGPLTGTNLRNGSASGDLNSTNLSLLCDGTGSLVSDTNPFTWADGDVLSIHGSIVVAEA
jgi:hypothetical protein